MDATNRTRMMDYSPSPPGDAIRQIVEVFEAGYRAAAALSTTAGGRSALEIQSELDSIELRMMSQIATICERFARDSTGRPLPTGQPLAAAPPPALEVVGDGLPELPPLPRN